MTDHVYVSTACQHAKDDKELHKKCRLTCKYCGATCACSGCDHTNLEAHPLDVLKAELRDAQQELCEYIVANQQLARKLALAEDRINAVLDYVAKLECTNCEHVHDEGDCGAMIPDGRACRCTWGPPQVAVDIRDLLKEQP